MVCRAIVKIVLFDANSIKEITIPCHRHCDAFHILHDFGFQKHVDFKEVAQGFLNEHDNFMDRREAFVEAVRCGQIQSEGQCKELYSEDLW